jgi:hypothetical protein
MVAALTNPFAYQKKREVKALAERGFFLAVFVGIGVVAGLFLGPLFIAACFGGPLVGTTFSAIFALPLAMLVGEAAARNWHDRQMVGIMDMITVALGFALGVALVVLFLSISPMEPSFLAGAASALTFVVALPLITFLWFVFRIKVWKVR